VYSLIDKNQVKNKIKKLLSEHPEGLHILDIARHVNMHRHTVTKYIYQLIGSGEIYYREVGTARLCYLKGMLVEMRKLGKRLKKK